MRDWHCPVLWLLTLQCHSHENQHFCWWFVSSHSLWNCNNKGGLACWASTSSCFGNDRSSSVNSARTAQIENISCLRFMLSWNHASVVSYYWLLLSNSEESSANQQKNEKFCKWCTYRMATLANASPLESHPLLPWITIIANNCRGIPPRFEKAVTIAARHSKGCYREYQRVSQQTLHVLNIFKIF